MPAAASPSPSAMGRRCCARPRPDRRRSSAPWWWRPPWARWPWTSGSRLARPPTAVDASGGVLSAPATRRAALRGDGHDSRPARRRARPRATLTRLSPQGLPGLLPLGWSPLAAFELAAAMPVGGSLPVDIARDPGARPRASRALRRNAARVDPGRRRPRARGRRPSRPTSMAWAATPWSSRTPGIRRSRCPRPGDMLAGPGHGGAARDRHEPQPSRARRVIPPDGRDRRRRAHRHLAHTAALGHRGLGGRHRDLHPRDGRRGLRGQATRSTSSSTAPAPRRCRWRRVRRRLRERRAVGSLPDHARAHVRGHRSHHGHGAPRHPRGPRGRSRRPPAAARRSSSARAMPRSPSRPWLSPRLRPSISARSSSTPSCRRAWPHPDRRGLARPCRARRSRHRRAAHAFGGRHRDDRRRGTDSCSRGSTASTACRRSWSWPWPSSRATASSRRPARACPGIVREGRYVLYRSTDSLRLRRRRHDRAVRGRRRSRSRPRSRPPAFPSWRRPTRRASTSLVALPGSVVVTAIVPGTSLAGTGTAAVVARPDHGPRPDPGRHPDHRDRGASRWIPGRRAHGAVRRDGHEPAAVRQRDRGRGEALQGRARRAASRCPCASSCPRRSACSRWSRSSPWSTRRATPSWRADFSMASAARGRPHGSDHDQGLRAAGLRRDEARLQLPRCERLRHPHRAGGQLRPRLRGPDPQHRQRGRVDVPGRQPGRPRDPRARDHPRLHLRSPAGHDHRPPGQRDDLHAQRVRRTGWNDRHRGGRRSREGRRGRRAAHPRRRPRPGRHPAARGTHRRAAREPLSGPAAELRQRRERATAGPRGERPAHHLGRQAALQQGSAPRVPRFPISAECPPTSGRPAPRTRSTTWPVGSRGRMGGSSTRPWPMPRSRATGPRVAWSRSRRPSAATWTAWGSSPPAAGVFGVEGVSQSNTILFWTYDSLLPGQPSARAGHGQGAPRGVEPAGRVAHLRARGRGLGHRESMQAASLS